MGSLVIGASEIVGGHIVEQLVAAGERPAAVSRSLRSAAAVEWLQADLTAPAAVKLPEFTTLYCTANAGLLAAAMPQLHQPTLKRVVAFTSTSIVTKANSDLAAERESVKAWAEAERDLIDICTRLGVAWTVLRPTIIYDEGRDANITRLAQLICKIGFIPLAGSGLGLPQPVHAQDVAIGALAAARSNAAANRIYALAGLDTISYREMIGRIFDGLHRRRRVLAVPASMWRAGFTMVKPFVANANEAMGTRMSQDMTFDATPAVRDFGWAPPAFRPVFTSLLRGK